MRYFIFVSYTMTSVGNFIISTLTEYMSHGSATEPGLAFANDPDTGLYATGQDSIGMSVGGTPCVRVDGNGVQILNHGHVVLMTMFPGNFILNQR